MISAEFTQGLERLSILHKTTLPYSPHQNGKQENFWAVVESQLLAMLSGKKDLTLGELNRCLQAWIEQGFHSQVHSETKQTPRDRFYESPNVLRESPSPETIRGAFRQHVTRKIRRSDVSITIEGKRFEVPSVYRHLGRITVAYARWDLSLVHLIDPKTGNRLARLWPIDKSRNAEGQRRSIENATSSVEPEESPEEYPPLLKQYLEDYAQKGRIPGYIVKDDEEEKR